MLYRPGPVAGSMSGSIGSTVASRNRGGTYFRTRAIPVNPSSVPQTDIRAIFSFLAAVWTNTLTADQRAGWEALAASQTFTNRIGATINLSGMPLFVKCNSARVQAGLANINDAPTLYVFNVLTSTPTVGTFVAGPPSTVAVTFYADPWAAVDDGALIVYASRPTNLTINYFTGPFQLAGAILGNTLLPPTPPATITLPFPSIAGQRIFFRFVAVTPDGRITTDMFTRLDT